MQVAQQVIARLCDHLTDTLRADRNSRSWREICDGDRIFIPSAGIMSSLLRLPFAIPLLCAAVLASTAHAASEDDESKACRHDAFQFCSADIPNKSKIKACMKAHYAELSPPCRAMFDQPSDDGASGASGASASPNDSTGTHGQGS